MMCRETIFQSSEAAEGPLQTCCQTWQSDTPKWLGLPWKVSGKKRLKDHQNDSICQNTPPMPWQERGNVSAKTNHIKLARELNQNRKKKILVLGAG